MSPAAGSTHAADFIPAPQDRPIVLRAARSMAENDLWHRRDAPGAREELVRRFLPMARRLAARYRSSDEPYDDLVQVASLGLLGAIDRFDLSHNVSFPAFAIPTILGELRRHFRNTGWVVHVPRGAQELALRVDRATREISAETGRAPDVQALAEHLHIEIESVLLGLEAGCAHYSTSLDAPALGVGYDTPQAVIDGLGRDDDRMGLVEATLSLKDAIARLPYRERMALTLRVGQDMKQAEVAQRMNCSQMQVSRLLRRAAARLRELLDPELTPLGRMPRMK